MMLANGVQRCMASRTTVLIRVDFFFTPAAGVCREKRGEKGGRSSLVPRFFWETIFLCKSRISCFDNKISERKPSPGAPELKLCAGEELAFRIRLQVNAYEFQ